MGNISLLDLLDKSLLKTVIQNSISLGVANSKTEMTTEELSNISNDLGVIFKGSFIATSSNTMPDDETFTGCYMSAEGFTFGDEIYNIAGVLDGALQFGFNSSTGKGVFCGGNAVIDIDGISGTDLLKWIVRQTATNDSKERIGKLSMALQGTNTTPTWELSLNSPAAAEMMVNGGFEDGDLTGWTATTETNGAWAIDDAVYYGGAYSAKWTPTEDGDGKTKVLMHFDGADAGTTMTDVSGKTWTARGNAQLDTAQKVFGTASLLLDGTGDYVDTPDHANFDVADGDWETEVRIRPHEIKNQGVYGQLYCYLILGPTGVIQAVFQDSSDTPHILEATTNYLVDTDYTISVGRYNNIFFLRINGALEDSEDVTGKTVKNSTTTFSIGRIGDTNNYYFNGWIDEFIFVKGKVIHEEDYTPAEAAYGEIYTEGVLTSDRVVVTGSTAHLISAYLRGSVLSGTIKAEVKWYDHASAGSLISTDVIGNLLSAGGWASKEQLLDSPATALSCAIVLTCSSSTTSEVNFDTISISLAAVSQKLWLADDGAHATRFAPSYESDLITLGHDYSYSNSTNYTYYGGPIVLHGKIKLDSILWDIRNAGTYTMTVSDWEENILATSDAVVTNGASADQSFDMGGLEMLPGWYTIRCTRAVTGLWYLTDTANTGYTDWEFKEKVVYRTGATVSGYYLPIKLVYYREKV